MAQGASKVATRAAAISVPLVPLIVKSPAVAGTAMVMNMSTRIISRIDVNPYFLVYASLRPVEIESNLIPEST
jgi:hypothetical protein